MLAAIVVIGEIMAAAFMLRLYTRMGEAVLIGHGLVVVPLLVFLACAALSRARQTGRVGLIRWFQFSVKSVLCLPVALALTMKIFQSEPVTMVIEVMLDSISYGIEAGNFGAIWQALEVGLNVSAVFISTMLIIGAGLSLVVDYLGEKYKQVPLQTLTAVFIGGIILPLAFNLLMIWSGALYWGIIIFAFMVMFYGAWMFAALKLHTSIFSPAAASTVKQPAQSEEPIAGENNSLSPAMLLGFAVFILLSMLLLPLILSRLRLKLLWPPFSAEFMMLAVLALTAAAALFMPAFVWFFLGAVSIVTGLLIALLFLEFRAQSRSGKIDSIINPTGPSQAKREGLLDSSSTALATAANPKHPFINHDAVRRFTWTDQDGQPQAWALIAADGMGNVEYAQIASQAVAGELLRFSRVALSADDQRAFATEAEFEDFVMKELIVPAVYSAQEEMRLRLGDAFLTKGNSTQVGAAVTFIFIVRYSPEILKVFILQAADTRAYLYTPGQRLLVPLAVENLDGGYFAFSDVRFDIGGRPWVAVDWRKSDFGLGEKAQTAIPLRAKRMELVSTALTSDMDDQEKQEAFRKRNAASNLIEVHKGASGVELSLVLPLVFVSNVDATVPQVFLATTDGFHDPRSDDMIVDDLETALSGAQSLQEVASLLVTECHSQLSLIDAVRPSFVRIFDFLRANQTLLSAALLRHNTEMTRLFDEFLKPNEEADRFVRETRRTFVRQVPADAAEPNRQIREQLEPMSIEEWIAYNEYMLTRPSPSSPRAPAGILYQSDLYCTGLTMWGLLADTEYWLTFATVEIEQWISEINQQINTAQASDQALIETRRKLLELQDGIYGWFLDELAYALRFAYRQEFVRVKPDDIGIAMAIIAPQPPKSTEEHLQSSLLLVAALFSIAACGALSIFAIVHWLKRKQASPPLTARVVSYQEVLGDAQLRQQLSEIISGNEGKAAFFIHPNDSSEPKHSFLLNIAASLCRGKSVSFLLANQVDEFLLRQIKSRAWLVTIPSFSYAGAPNLEGWQEHHYDFYHHDEAWIRQRWQPVVRLMQELGVRIISPLGGQMAVSDENNGRAQEGFSDAGCVGEAIYFLGEQFAVEVNPRLTHFADHHDILNAPAYWTGRPVGPQADSESVVLSTALLLALSALIAITLKHIVDRKYRVLDATAARVIGYSELLNGLDTSSIRSLLYPACGLDMATVFGDFIRTLSVLEDVHLADAGFQYSIEQIRGALTSYLKGPDDYYQIIDEQESNTRFDRFVVTVQDKLQARTLRIHLHQYNYLSFIPRLANISDLTIVKFPGVYGRLSQGFAKASYYDNILAHTKAGGYILVTHAQPPSRRSQLRRLELIATNCTAEPITLELLRRHGIQTLLEQDSYVSWHGNPHEHALLRSHRYMLFRLKAVKDTGVAENRLLDRDPQDNYAATATATQDGSHSYEFLSLIGLLLSTAVVAMAKSSGASPEGTITVSRISAEDASRRGELEELFLQAEIFNQTWIDRILNTVQHPDSITLVAKDGSRIVGCIACARPSEKETIKYMTYPLQRAERHDIALDHSTHYLVGIAVRKSHRGRGIGRRLACGYVGAAQQAGFRYIAMHRLKFRFRGREAEEDALTALLFKHFGPMVVANNIPTKRNNLLVMDLTQPAQWGGGAGMIPALRYVLGERRARKHQAWIEQVGFWGVTIYLLLKTGAVGLGAVGIIAAVWFAFLALHFARISAMPHAPPLKGILTLTLLNFALLALITVSLSGIPSIIAHLSLGGIIVGTLAYGLGFAVSTLIHHQANLNWPYYTITEKSSYYEINGSIVPVAWQDPRMQLLNCIVQMQSVTGSSARLIKQTVFIRARNNQDYLDKKHAFEALLRDKLSGQFPPTSYIAQPHLSGAEVSMEFMAIVPKRNQEVSIEYKDIAGVRVALIKHDGLEWVEAKGITDERAIGVEAQSESAFRIMRQILAEAASQPLTFADVMRQWNYIENIVGHSQGAQQNYQIFNDVRARNYQEAVFDTKYPAATGIGMAGTEDLNTGGVVLEFTALNRAARPDVVVQGANNRLQISAHSYGTEKLEEGVSAQQKATPKFERAKVVLIPKAGKWYVHIFVSGTAAIRGQDTQHISLPEALAERAKDLRDEFEARLEGAYMRDSLIKLSHAQQIIRSSARLQSAAVNIFVVPHTSWFGACRHWSVVTPAYNRGSLPKGALPILEVRAVMRDWVGADAAQQTALTLANIGHLISQENLMDEGNLGALNLGFSVGARLKDMTRARTYVKFPRHYAQVSTVTDRNLPGLPDLGVYGSVCRPNLLVEIEGDAVVKIDTRKSAFRHYWQWWGSWQPLDAENDELQRRLKLALAFLERSLLPIEQAALRHVVIRRGPPQYRGPSLSLRVPFTKTVYLYLNRGASYREIVQQLVAALGGRSLREAGEYQQRLAVAALRQKAEEHYRLLSRSESQQAFRNVWQAAQELVTTEGVEKVLTKIFSKRAKAQAEFMGELVCARALETAMSPQALGMLLSAEVLAMVITGAEIIELSLERFQSRPGSRPEIDCLLRLHQPYAVTIWVPYEAGERLEYRESRRYLVPGDYLVESKTDDRSVNLSAAIQIAQDDKIDKYKGVASSMIDAGYDIRGFIFAMSGDVVPAHGWHRFFAYSEASPETLATGREVAIAVAYIPDRIMEKGHDRLNRNERKWVRELLRDIRKLWWHEGRPEQMMPVFLRWNYVLAALVSEFGVSGTQLRLTAARSLASGGYASYSADTAQKKQNWVRIFEYLDREHARLISNFIQEQENIISLVSPEDHGPEFETHAVSALSVAVAVIALVIAALLILQRLLLQVS